MLVYAKGAFIWLPQGMFGLKCLLKHLFCIGGSDELKSNWSNLHNLKCNTMGF